MPNVLIIDDEQGTRVVLTKILKKSFSNLEIHTASRGNEGIDLAQKCEPDTIIVDIMMPDIDGFTVCEKLRSYQSTKDTPIIILTGAEYQMETKIRALESGADAFLTKPTRRAELVAQVKSMLRIKSAEDKIRNEKEFLEELVKERTESLNNELHERIVAEKKLKQMQKKLRSLTFHIQSLQEEERSRIARDLHDELGQMLTAIKLGHGWLLKKLTPDSDLPIQDGVITQIKNLCEVTDNLFLATNRIISDLRPNVLHELGLLAAIKWFCNDFQKKTGFPCELDLQTKNEPEISEDKSIAAFRILQEALTNAARHSGGCKISIQVKSESDKVLKFVIKDNGKGITKEDILHSGSFGIMGMKERAEQFKWKLQIAGDPGKGTVVTLKLTLE